MKNEITQKKLTILNRKDKESFLKLLLSLEMQEKSNNQVPVSVFLQKDD